MKREETLMNLHLPVKDFLKQIPVSERVQTLHDCMYVNKTHMAIRK